MANTLKIKRGQKANLPTLADGELGFCKDTSELYVGNGTANVKVGSVAEPIPNTFATIQAWALSKKEIGNHYGYLPEEHPIMQAGLAGGMPSSSYEYGATVELLIAQNSRRMTVHYSSLGLWSYESGTADAENTWSAWRSVKDADTAKKADTAINADTVDGLHASSFTPYTFVNGTDINTIYKPGFYAGIFANYPAGALDGQGNLIVLPYADGGGVQAGWTRQIFISAHSSQMYIRQAIANNWQGWGKFVKMHVGTAAPSSGIQPDDLWIDTGSSLLKYYRSDNQWASVGAAYT